MDSRSASRCWVSTSKKPNYIHILTDDRKADEEGEEKLAQALAMSLSHKVASVQIQGTKEAGQAPRQVSTTKEEMLAEAMAMSLEQEDKSDPMKEETRVPDEEKLLALALAMSLEQEEDG